MPTDKGHCRHGEFILTEGCPQCIAEAQASEETNGVATGELQINNDQYPGNTHPPYCLTGGAVVPSVTQVLGILDKPGLPHWSWECGRQGIDYRDVRDEAARVGTIAHYLIASHLKGEKADTSEFYPDLVDKARASLAKYLAWEKKNPLVPVIIETPFVSEEFRFGGTPDLLADIGGEFVLIDFKTGGGIYKSHFSQVAAYRKLLEEQGWPVIKAWILRISPSENGEAELTAAIDLDRYWQIFQHCLGIYKLQGGDR